MKRLIAAMLALTLCASLTACGSTTASDATAQDYTNIIAESRSDDLNESYAITAGQNGEPVSYTHLPTEF